MTHPRFFCEQIPAAPSSFMLPDAVAHHVRVRRLKAGQEVVLFDGSGKEFYACLQFADNGAPFALTTETQSIDRELPHHITLVQGIASQDRMDWVVEKAVELGVKALVPVLADRSVVKLDADRAKKRVAHWQKIVVSASEQCGRNQLMDIKNPCDTKEALAHVNHGPILWCHTNPLSSPISEPALLQAISRVQRACIVVGPEGGFSEREMRLWTQTGAQAISLGPRILRTETAGLVAVATLNALLETS